MRKAFFPLLASLLLAGVAAGALVATTAKAQTETRQPVMVAMAGPSTLMAQNMAAPDRDMGMANAADRATRRRQRCEDNYARAVGRMAYLETRLNLTGAQQPLFSAWRTVRLDIAKRRADDCTQRSANTDRAAPSPVDRMSRMEDRLKKRLADLSAERPAFAALYGALTPDQRQALSLDRRGSFRQAMGRRRGMGRGMMRRDARPMSGPPAASPQ